MLRLRVPHPDELDLLNALCLRSKAVWGYDASFIEACRDELTLTALDLLQTQMQVAEDDTGVVGLAQISVGRGNAVLEKLFVEPASLPTGAGSVLFRWAADAARVAGCAQISIDADPDAAPFYIRMGARQVGTASSGSIPGRLLPRLILEL